MKFINALNKPSLKLLLSYQRLSTFLLYRISNPTMEEIGTTNPEYQPLRVLWCRLCAQAQKIIPLAPIHSFTKQIVPSMYQESLSWSRLISITRVFRNHLINSPFHQKHFRHPWFFSFSFHFHRILSWWACRSWREPRKFFSFCAFTCLSNNSLIS